MRHLFRINDGGEHWTYSAIDRDEALKMHIKLNYEDAGIEYPPDGDVECEMLPDEKAVKVGDCEPDGKTIEQSARAWADAEEGLVSTTCF